MGDAQGVRSRNIARALDPALVPGECGRGTARAPGCGILAISLRGFVAYPRPVLEQLASTIRGFPVHCRFLLDGQVQLHAQHLVTGNPDKFQCGLTWLRERRPELGPVLNNFVSLMGAPLLARYGYFSRKRNGAPTQPSEIHGEEGLGSGFPRAEDWHG